MATTIATNIFGNLAGILRHKVTTRADSRLPKTVRLLN